MEMPPVCTEQRNVKTDLAGIAITDRMLKVTVLFEGAWEQAEKHMRKGRALAKALGSNKSLPKNVVQGLYGEVQVQYGIILDCTRLFASIVDYATEEGVRIKPSHGMFTLGKTMACALEEIHLFKLALGIEEILPKRVFKGMCTNLMQCRALKDTPDAASVMSMISLCEDEIAREVLELLVAMSA